MSRCFPFPPPGYEKKTRTDDVELLSKEKLIEKKQKKEKKEKKREGKEKKDKERSKDRHKEKKDRDKDKKHKDKKKDKDRDKEKRRSSDDKVKNSSEKRVEGISESYNGGKPSGINQQSEVKASKPVENLGRGTGGTERTDHQMVESISRTNQWRTEGMDRVVEKNFGQRSKEDEQSDVQKGDWQRKRVGEGYMGGTMVQNITRVDKEGVGNDRNNDDKKAGQTHINGEVLTHSAIGRSFTGVDQERVEGMARLMEKSAEKGKEKNKRKASNDKHGDKSRKQEKKSKGTAKDGNREKEKEKEKEKEIEEKCDSKNNKHATFTVRGKDCIDTPIIEPLHIPKDSPNGAAIGGHIRKRQDFESNGFLHETEVRPNKLLKPTFSSHAFTENGRKLEPCRTGAQCASDLQIASNNNKADNKDNRINGILEAHTPLVQSTKSPTSSSHISENGRETSTKPPHPDTKYLNKILSLPTVEELCDFDDQEWLFRSDNVKSQKPKDESTWEEKRPPQVWASAIPIEHADIYALPYVIPY